MTFTSTQIVIVVLSTCVLALGVTLMVVYNTLKDRLRDRTIMFEEADASVKKLLNILAGERKQMAGLDMRNEKLTESITDGQTALMVSLNTQLRETERRAIESETAVNLMRPSLALPEAEPKSDDAGLSIFDELTQTIDLSDAEPATDEIPETPATNVPRARRQSPAKR